MIDHLWQSTLVVGLIWMLTTALARNRAAVRYRLWLAASGKFLLPFSLLTALGRQFEWRAAATAFPGDWSVAIEHALSPATLAPVPAIAAAMDLRGLLLTAWAGGALLVLLFWWRSYDDIRRALRHATAIGSDSLGLPASLRVVSSPYLLEPGVVGVFRPVLLLPDGIADRLTRPQLETVLAHELSHLRRRDNLAAALHMVVETLFWFHPAVWWIERRLIDERERACDQSVLEAGADPDAYAGGILSVCQTYVESQCLCAPGVSGANLRQRIEAIMRNERALSLGGWKKSVIVAGILVAVGWPLGIGVMHAPALRAQSPQVTFDPNGPAFEVVSVKRNVSGQPTPGGDVYMRGGIYRTVNFSVRQMIVSAARLQGLQVVGGPEWMSKDAYDVTASLGRDWDYVDNRPSPNMFAVVRTLLANRFKLAVHYETREMPAYALVMARSDGRWGPSLRKASVDCRTVDFTKPAPTAKLRHGFCGGIRFSAGAAVGQGATMTQLAKNLVGMGRLVIDRTGIVEPVDLELAWTPRGLAAAPASAGPPQEPVFGDGVSMFTALKEQLGLKLEPIKATVEVLVIDRIDRPTED